MDSTVSSTDEQAVPMHYPGFVFRVLREEGVDPESLLAGTGLTPETLGDPRHRTGLEPPRRLFLNAIEQTGDPHLGVRLGSRFEPHHIGLPAYTAMSAATFADALDVMNRFFSLTFPLIEFTFPCSDADPRPDEVALRIRPRLHLEDLTYFVAVSALIACDGLCKAILRCGRFATRAEANAAKPQDWARVAPRIDFPIRFGAQDHRLYFPKTLLDCRLPGAEPINHQKFVELCKGFSAAAGHPQSLISRVVTILQERPSSTASLPEVAAALGFSDRGLRRHLQKSGTSFRHLVDQVRAQRARTMLTTTSQPIKSIAHDLGFDSASNFSRSFKRWTGSSPQAFRDSQ